MLQESAQAAPRCSERCCIDAGMCTSDASAVALLGASPVRRWVDPRPNRIPKRKDTMDQTTFDTYVRRAASLLDRRALVGGASAVLLSIAGLPLAAKAEKQHELA